MGRSAFAVVVGALAAVSPASPQSRNSHFPELAALFNEWRAFQKPKIVNGVPDYSRPAMAAQHEQLAGYQRRLNAIDTTGWTVPQRVDYHIVRAEMKGMEFDHVTLRPWENDPSFYIMIFESRSDQPAREGPHVEGAIELWTYRFPLNTLPAAELASRILRIPPLLEQAKKNLVGRKKDLWTSSLRDFAGQNEELQRLSARLAGNHPAIDLAIRNARTATDDFRSWLEHEAPSRTEPSGVGIENYNWYLANVKLLPYTWRDEVALMQHELVRATAALALEESHNRRLPPLEPIVSAQAWEQRFNSAVSEYMTFLRDHDIVTVKDYYDSALRARLGRFNPGPREFFNEVSYRDPIVMLTHDYHWIDLAQAEEGPHPDPIRREPLLYNLFDTRTEGFATAMEEMMMHAGFLDSHPHGRELVYILIAERAARALGDLMMHANQLTLEQAASFAATNTPRGWLRTTGTTVWGEQHLYLEQPAYGTSYLVGKAELERILGERARQLGDQFTIKRYMDDLNAIGMIPTTLLRWEMTGEMDPILK